MAQTAKSTNGSSGRIVSLHPDQAQVGMSAANRRKAIDAAIWFTASPHEWTWSQEEQQAMAGYVLWAHQRLSAIGQLVDGPLNH